MNELVFVLIPHIVRGQDIIETNLMGIASVSFASAVRQAQPGATITVGLVVENATDLFTAGFRIKFDPKVLRLNNVAAGNLLTVAWKASDASTKNIINDIGEASVTLTRVAGASGIFRVGYAGYVYVPGVGGGDYDRREAGSTIAHRGASISCVEQVSVAWSKYQLRGASTGCVGQAFVLAAQVFMPVFGSQMTNLQTQIKERTYARTYRQELTRF